ncbi:MAG TPA: cytochrome P450 [Acidimicrobiales bacterium]|nr:cytochrome P450 [Acidimicrobiales bacterium]
MAVFNPFDPAFADDPFDALAELRSGCPVAEAMPGLHVVARYEDCVHVLRDWPSFSSAGGGSLATDMPPDTITINATDGPWHVRLRRMLQSVLRPVHFLEQTDFIQEKSVELVEAILPAGKADLVSDIAHKLPARVILKMIGVDDDDYVKVRGWTQEVEDSADPEHGVSMADLYSRRIPHPAVDAFDDYMQLLIEDRRSGKVKADDLVTRMVGFEDEDGQPFTDSEIRSQLGFVLIAGNHTTGNLIGNLFSVLVKDPELYARLRADRGLVDQAIEESLRFDSPVQGVFRTVVSDIDLQQVALEHSNKVVVQLQSANRDSTLFDDPDRFDPERPNLDKHIAFGYGVHFCIGAPLSRLEARLVLNTFLDRVESFSLLDGASTTVTTRSVVNRGPSSLPVQFTVAHP